MRFLWIIVLLGLLAFVLTACPKPAPEDTGTPTIDDQNMRKPDFGGSETTPPADTTTPPAEGTTPPPGETPPPPPPPPAGGS